MNFCRSIIRDLMNCDDDHIGEIRIQKAKEELMDFLGCDEYELGVFLIFFVVVDTDTEISIK